MEPSLDFEFRFFSGFLATIQARDLAGPARVTHMLLTVTPLPIEGVDLEVTETQVLRQKIETGPIPEGTRGQAELRGAFVVGEGRYKVRWDLQDSINHFCSVEWKIDARRAKSKKNVKGSLRSGEVGDSRVYLFRSEDSVIDPDASPLNVKVFMNFDVWRRRETAASVHLWQYTRRLATLRALARHPRIGKISMVVYSLEEQEVFYRHGLQEKIDFAPMEQAIAKLSPAFVAFEQLGRHKEREFFGDLLLKEVQADDVGAFIFIGPDFQFGKKLSEEDVATLEAAPAPAFYLKTSSSPWKGLVGNAIRAMDGDEINIHTPRRLARAVEKIVQGAKSN